MTTLGVLAKTVRSKNAGTDRITFDIIFDDLDVYNRVLQSGAVTKPKMAELFGIQEDRITDFVEYRPAMAIKFTMKRARPSGSPGEGDLFGCQQYPPLLDVVIPE